jgi:hypothetical protein
MPSEIRKKSSNFFDHFDMFGTGPPQFTIDGKQQVGTSMGIVATLFISVVMLTYSILKGYQLAIKHNPSISVSYKSDVYSSEEEPLDLDNHNFRFMFAL